MDHPALRRFFASIILPSILALGFFVLMIFLVILPSLEKNIMQGKKETISELTHTVLSLLEEFETEVQSGRLPLDSAKTIAARRIREIRYGRESKDYFWIIDRQPVMIMHPYRTELIGTDLSEYRDPDGTLLFVEATKTVERKGEGFIRYMWQWKDDSTRIVPKLSYVKSFGPWDWIVGTGIYLEDVRLEIRYLKHRLLLITLLFAILISALLAFIIRQSLSIENRRSEAEKNLRMSRMKYKSLVEVSTEGTLMIMDDRVIFSNLKFSDLCGYSTLELRDMGFEDLFSHEWTDLKSSFTDPKKSVSLETGLAVKGGKSKEVVVSASVVTYAQEPAYILIVKEISSSRDFGKATEKLSEELQYTLLQMTREITPLIRDLKKCEADTPADEAARLMVRKKRDVLFVSSGGSINGVITANDLYKRVLAKGRPRSTPAGEIMTAPVISIPDSAPVYEVLLAFKQHNVSHLATEDHTGKLNGVIACADLAELHRNTVSFLLTEIHKAETVDELAAIYKRLPVLINSLLESGAGTSGLTAMITAVADAMLNRSIQLALENLGPVPAQFAFMVMGSEGRKEQTLATDQDNAIIFEDVEDDKLEQTRDYFLELGEQVSQDLNTIGYQFCKGGVMASNPKWTCSLSEWKNQFSHWINQSTPQDILEAAVFFDFRCGYGRCSLVDELREHVQQLTSHTSVFLYHMAQAVLNFKAPLNIFGTIVGEGTTAEGPSLDIKKVMLPIVSFIRLYAIREKIDQTSSLGRLEGLHQQKSIDEDTYLNLIHSCEFLMKLRLHVQVKSIAANEKAGNIIYMNELTRMKTAELKHLFNEINTLQSKVSFDFKGGE